MIDIDQLHLIQRTIERMLREKGTKRIALFPFGQGGMLVKNVLNECYGQKADLIVGDRYASFNPAIKPLSYLREIDCSQYVLLFTIIDVNKLHYLEDVKPFFSENDIYTVCLEPETKYTRCGKYSYGPLCNNQFVESVGSFCSFDEGCEVVQNHAVDYLSTSPFIYHDKSTNNIFGDYNSENHIRCSWHFDGVRPRGIVRDLRRITIGSDVWLSRNVLIANGRISAME